VTFPDAAFISKSFPEISQVSLLDQGGQKIVFRGQHSTHGEVVLKFAEPDIRTEREIEAVTSFPFTFVPRILTSGKVIHNGNYFAYLIEQFVKGESLRKVLTARHKLTLTESVQLLTDLIETEQQVETQNIVHRDIKPENIIAGIDGHFWLLDFGIARHLDKVSLTKTAQKFGPATVGYAAPEQLKNRKQELDVRADLFSIGLVAFECLNGFNPFIDGARDVLEVLRRSETMQIPTLPISGDNNGDLVGFIGSLTAKPTSLRPKTAGKAMELLRGLLPSLTL